MTNDSAGHQSASPRGSGAVMPALVIAVAELAHYAVGDFDVDDLLHELCAAAVNALRGPNPGVVVGVMALDGSRTRFVQASHPWVVPLEALQEAEQTGPCRVAADTGQPVLAQSPAQLAATGPLFAAAAAAAGVMAVLVLPLMSRGRCWGTLDLYWGTPHSPSDDEHAAAQLLADVAVSYLVMAADRAEMTAAKAQLAQQVLHDQLTGLPNRELIHELIHHALNTAERHRSCVAVLFVDVNKFKTVNDRYGHLAGDHVLQVIARRLRQTVRAGDSVGRLSGDEFLILCEDLPADLADAAININRLAGRVTAAITEPITVGDHTLHVTASVGIGITGDRPSPRDLIHEADLAMYEAKNRHTTTHTPDDDNGTPTPNAAISGSRDTC